MALPNSGISSAPSQAAPPQVASSESHLFVFTAAKAGMSGVDKEKVNRVVYEMSKDSAYFKNAKRHDTRLERHIEEMQSKLRKTTEVELEAAKLSSERRRIQLEATRNLSRVWAVVDMDMFYAAVEMMDNPSLIGKPVAVGGMSMISTANYEARKYGVRAAMPGFIAKKLCPELVFVGHHFDRYKEVADQARKVFAEYDPEFEAMSLDEAYLDITDACKSRLEVEVASIGDGSAMPSMISVADRLVQELRQKVITATGGLTCSAGIACNPMLAKIASNFNKPNGQFCVPNTRDEIMKFMSDLSVRTVPGIGKVAEKELACLGVNTCGDLLAQLPRLSLVMTPHRTDWLTSIALGIQSAVREAPETDGPGRKSIGLERTFRALSHPDELLSKCKELCQKLSQQMMEQGLKAKTVTLKLKTTGFEVRSKSVTLKRFVDDAPSLISAATELLEHEFPVTLRLMGVRMTHFENEKSYTAGIKRYFHTSTGPLPTSSSSGDPPEVVYISTQTDSECEDMGLLMASSDTSGAESDGPVPPQPKRNKHLPPAKSEATCAPPGKEDVIEVEPDDDVVLVGVTPPVKRSEQLLASATGKQLWPTAAQQAPAVCPLCNAAISGTVVDVNRHVDQCLRLSTETKPLRVSNDATGKHSPIGRRGSMDAFVASKPCAKP